MEQVEIGDAILYCGDALDVARSLPDNSVDLIATDPPYFKVKKEEWDHQWDKPAEFLAWLSGHLEEWQRILKPNGSLYVFASPRMAARVEVATLDRFNVLNHIVWNKTDAGGRHRQVCKDALRRFFPATERLVFAEHYGADNMAKGEAGYQAKCDELRGFVFEPLRAYLLEERDRAGWTTRQVAEAFQKKTGSRTVTGMAGHWFERVQWALPTEKNYQWLQDLFNDKGSGYLTREYEDLKREYEDLKREYEDLRRPFRVTAEVPYTDVWNFKTVMGYPGKHLCEKPLDMIEHIILSSSREGDTVLDCFAGSGTTGVACKRWNREYILIEKEAEYCEIARRRLTAEDNLFSEAEKC